MIRAVATGGREQGKPAEAGHCSRRRDPAPGMWGHSVPKKPSWTSAALEQAAAAQGAARPPPAQGRALRLAVCANCLLVDCALSLSLPTLAPEPGFFPKHLPGTGVRHGGPRPAQNLQKRLKGRASWQEDVQQRRYCVVGVGKGFPGRKLVSRSLKQ